MRLILWRHGRTAWNAQGRFQGHHDVDLDEVGIAQVQTAAARLAAYEPTLIVSSDLRRAARTAQPLADLLAKPVSYDPRLRERHFGRWQGLTWPEISVRFPVDAMAWANGEAPIDHEIEPLDDLVARVMAGLAAVIERVGDEGTAVVVTHGGPARAGCAGLLGWPAQLGHTLGTLANSHFSEMTFDQRRGWQLRAHNL